MSDPLQVMAASDDSTTISGLAIVTKTAAAGLYPIEYTVYYRGTYVMNVTGPDGQVNELMPPCLESTRIDCCCT